MPHKRGRPRKPAVPRTPSGYISRAIVDPTETERIMETALAYRQHQYGLTYAQARDQKAESELGRLALAGRLSPAQYTAGVAYRECSIAARMALEAPDSLVRGNPGSGGHNVPSEAWIASAVAAVARWEVMKEWAKKAHAKRVLDWLIVEDKPCNSWQVFKARGGLSYIAKRMGGN